MDTDKRRIIELFNKNVKGKRPNLSKYESRHDGREGHWLEVKMWVVPNASNLPDLHGYEMKKSTRGKTSFGDWSADYYIFKNNKYNITRDDFLMIFGKSNIKKAGRFSWSGEPCPVISHFNSFGQRLFVDKKQNVIIKYSYSRDNRLDKASVVPKIMQIDNLIIAQWEAGSIKRKLEKKFNVKGWFRCIKNLDGLYTKIVFGDPVTFDIWIKSVKRGDVFFDSGMYQGNMRPYSQWRASNSYWDNLVTSSY